MKNTRKKKKNWEEDLQRTEKHNDLLLVLGTRHHSTIHQALDTGASPCDRRTQCYRKFALGLWCGDSTTQQSSEQVIIDQHRQMLLSAES